jgi:3,4-dihydroxy 2-butanone 4-phosphate synthase/GTP cyclohydrolase II
MEALAFSPIEEIVAEVAAGGLVIVADDPARENEADLIGAASLATSAMIAFMATHGRGLICAPITRERVEELSLQPMARRNREGHRTAFTVAVDAAEGVTTGISAADRARTIGLLANPAAGPESLVQPGHVFPLQAADDGVLRRAGHTEAAVDLARMAGLPAAGALREPMHEDGTIARLGDHGSYQRPHNQPACTITQII